MAAVARSSDTALQNTTKRSRSDSLSDQDYKRRRTEGLSSPPKTAQPQETEAAVAHEGGQEQEARQTHRLGRDDSAIAHWAATSTWPLDFASTKFSMAGDGKSAVSGKRRLQAIDQQEASSSYTHHSSQRRCLEGNGVFFRPTDSELNKEGQALIGSLQERRRLLKYSPFPPEYFSKVLREISDQNEARIFRDITPWIVPSADILRLCGEPGLDNIAEEIDTQWRCEHMSTTAPKPDFAVGLRPEAFSKQESERLKNVATLRRPFMLTYSICYPFLTCEVKCGDRGVAEAERQNLNSASSAVRNIIEVYQEAFGPDAPETRSLSEVPLAFSISHDNTVVNINCHYAVYDGKDSTHAWKYHHILVEHVSLVLQNGLDREKSYSFVRNVYDEFAPQHLARIKRAAAALPDAPRTSGTVPAGSSMSSTGDDLEQTAGGNDGFKKPQRPSDAGVSSEVKQLTRQLAEQRKEAESRQQQLEQNLAEQQRGFAELTRQLAEMRQRLP